MKFKDFLKTFLGENYILQALWNRYLPYHKKSAGTLWKLTDDLEK